MVLIRLLTDSFYYACYDSFGLNVTLCLDRKHVEHGSIVFKNRENWSRHTTTIEIFRTGGVMFLLARMRDWSCYHQKTSKAFTSPGLQMLLINEACMDQVGAELWREDIVTSNNAMCVMTATPTPAS